MVGTWGERIEDEEVPLEAKRWGGGGDSMVEERRSFGGGATVAAARIRERDDGEEAGEEDEDVKRGIRFPNRALNDHRHWFESKSKL